MSAVRIELSLTNVGKEFSAIAIDIVIEHFEDFTSFHLTFCRLTHKKRELLADLSTLCRKISLKSFFHLNNSCIMLLKFHL